MQTALTQSLKSSKRDSSGHTQPGAGLLFLKEEEMRFAQDKLFFAFRDLTTTSDTILRGLGFGRAHHRALHWIGRRPGLTVGELLLVLGVTKQSLTRVLGPLMRQGYVVQMRGQSDRRQRLLTLTENGVILERKLFEPMRERLIAAYREAGGPAVEGFRRVLNGLTSPQGRRYLETLEVSQPRPPAPGG